MVFDRVVKIQEWWPREFSLNCFLSHIPRSIFLRFSMFERSLWLIHSYRQGSDLDRNRIDVRKETRLTSTDFSAFKICFRLFSVFDLTNPNFYTFSLSSSVGAKTESRTIKLPKSNNLPKFWIRFDYNVKTTRFHVAFCDRTDWVWFNRTGTKRIEPPGLEQ